MRKPLPKNWVNDGTLIHLPWDDSGRPVRIPIATCYDERDAERIVKCVNSCQDIMDFLDSLKYQNLPEHIYDKARDLLEQLK